VLNLEEFQELIEEIVQDSRFYEMQHRHVLQVVNMDCYFIVF